MSRLISALTHQKTIKKESLVKRLFPLNYATKDQINRSAGKEVFSADYRVPGQCRTGELPLELKTIIPKKMAKQRVIFPLEKKNSTLLLVSGRPP